MNIRNLKRDLKRAAKAAHRSGANINPNGIGGWIEDRKAYGYGDTCCLLIAYLYGEKDNGDFVSDAANKAGVAREEMKSVEWGFMDIESDSACHKFWKIGNEIRKELIKEKIMVL